MTGSVVWAESPCTLPGWYEGTNAQTSIPFDGTSAARVLRRSVCRLREMARAGPKGCGGSRRSGGKVGSTQTQQALKPDRPGGGNGSAPFQRRTAGVVW